jgi:hypothetical protein
MVAVVMPAIKLMAAILKGGCMVSDFRFKFEPGHRITFLRAMVIMLGAAYVGCFIAGLMCISLIALIGIGLDKLGFLDFWAVVSPYAVYMNGDVILAFGISGLGLLAFLILFAVGELLTRLMNKK